MKKNIIVCFLLAALVGWSAARLDAQEVDKAEDDLVIGLSPSAQLTLSTPEYCVTAGDVYTLAYFAGSNSIQYTTTVDSTYNIRGSNIEIRSSNLNLLLYDDSNRKFSR
jgi:hypothetical protein